jgi:hypothetical protein
MINSCPLPFVRPGAIIPVTIDPPDLTARNPQIVRDTYDKRRRYYERITRDEHLKDYPMDSWMSMKVFEKAKKRILRQTLEKFSMSERAREAVWDKCGTKKRAAKVGLLDDTEQGCLILWFRATGLSSAQSRHALGNLKYVAIYPDGTQWYLYDVIEQPDSKAVEIEFARRKAKDRPEQLQVSAGMSELSRAVQHLREENGTAHKVLQSQVEAMGHEVKTIQFAAPATGRDEKVNPLIIFAKGFREIHYPTGVLKIPNARNRARVLEILFKHQRDDREEWLDWNSLGAKAGYTDTSTGFLRNIEDRKRPQVRRFIESIVDVERSQHNGEKGEKVRLKPGYRFEQLD